MVKVKLPKMAQNGPKNGKLSKRVETISKTHIKSEKIEKKIKKYFRVTTPPFYPQKGQNGSKKGKLVKRMVEMGKLDMN